jgi:hypothetical protein
VEGVIGAWGREVAVAIERANNGAGRVDDGDDDRQGEGVGDDESEEAGEADGKLGEHVDDCLSYCLILCSVRRQRKSASVRESDRKTPRIARLSILYVRLLHLGGSVKY